MSPFCDPAGKFPCAVKETRKACIRLCAALCRFVEQGFECFCNPKFVM